MISSRDVAIVNSLLVLAQDHPPTANARIVAALATTTGGMFAFGFNQKKTHPLQARYTRNPEKIYLHAEVDALLNGAKRLTDLSYSTLYVVRMKHDENGGWVRGLAKPCETCVAVMGKYGVKRVLYTGERREIWEVVR